MTSQLPSFRLCGAGLLAFRAPAEALEAINRLNGDYGAHCRAARAVAEEYFDARRVLTDLLERSFSRETKESFTSSLTTP